MSAQVTIVGAFRQVDGTWFVGVSDKKFRAQGTGGTFAKALQDASLNFANGPTRTALWVVSKAQPAGYPLAYVDALSTRTFDGTQWIEVLAWGEELGTLAAITMLDGRVGVPLVATGARVVFWRNKCWVSVEAAPIEDTFDVADAAFAEVG